MTGTLAGFLGASIIAIASVALLPFCDPHLKNNRPFFTDKLGSQGRTGLTLQKKIVLVLAITVWGGLGSVVDSALGGWFQASVVDERTGKVIEATGGKQVSASNVFLKG